MYKIITDGSCDLTTQYIQQHDLINVPFSISFGDEGNKKEGVELNVADFYQKMIANPKVFPKTSTPSIGDYLTVMEASLRHGFDLIVICITSKFSGSFNAACNARDMLADKYANRIEVIDSQVNTVLQADRLMSFSITLMARWSRAGSSLPLDRWIILSPAAGWEGSPQLVRVCCR